MTLLRTAVIVLAMLGVMVLAGTAAAATYKVPDLTAREPAKAPFLTVTMTLPKGMKYLPYHVINRLDNTGGWFQGGGYVRAFNIGQTPFGTATPDGLASAFGFGWQRRRPGSCKAITYGDGQASTVGKITICQYYFEPVGDWGQQNEALWKPTAGGYLVLSLTLNYRATKSSTYPPFNSRVFSEALAIMKSANRVG